MPSPGGNKVKPPSITDWIAKFPEKCHLDKRAVYSTEDIAKHPSTVEEFHDFSNAGEGEKKVRYGYVCDVNVGWYSHCCFCHDRSQKAAVTDDRHYEYNTPVQNSQRSAYLSHLCTK